MQNFMGSTTPHHTPTGSPAFTHHNPWAHSAICCDHDHGASSSFNHQQQQQKQHQQYSHPRMYSHPQSQSHSRTSSISISQPLMPNQPGAAGVHATSNQLQAACDILTIDQCGEECALESYCCDGDYCCDDHHHEHAHDGCDDAEVCCEDPKCTETEISPACQDQCGHVQANANQYQNALIHPHLQTSMEGLEQWADSKEGCNALQELLECCNQPDCNIPVCTTDNADVHPPPIDPLAAMFASIAAQPAIPTSSADLTPTSAVEAMSHTCHWGNCHLVFKSMPDLLAHVASDHLSAWGTAAKPPQVTHHPTVPAPAPAPAPRPLSASINSVSLFVAAPPSHTHVQGYNHNASASVNSALSTPQTSETDQLLSCLWDDCFPMTDLPSATSESFHPHALAGGQHVIQSQAYNHDNNLAHTHNQGTNQAHSHASHDHSHTAANGEPFSPGTMLRHVLEEHLGVPGEIIGWPNQPNLDSQHAAQLLDKHHHHHHVDPHQLGHQHVEHAHQHNHSHAHQHPHGHTHPHAHPHSHHYQCPTPPSTVNTTSSTSPPLVSAPNKPLVCLWPGCPIEQAFPDSASLMDHLSEVHIPKGKDSYTCHWDGCGDGEGRIFKSRQKVLRHLQSHTGHKPFVCGVCDQAFSEAAPLSAHMRRHAQQKPFQCDHPGCGKTFAVSSSLTIHMRTHNGEKPYICPHCGRGFVEASNLTKHIRTHTGERPFACVHPGCGKRFSRPDQLKRHMCVHDKDKVVSSTSGSGAGHARRRSSANIAVGSSAPTTVNVSPSAGSGMGLGLGLGIGAGSMAMPAATEAGA